MHLCCLSFITAAEQRRNKHSNLYTLLIDVPMEAVDGGGGGGAQSDFLQLLLRGTFADVPLIPHQLVHRPSHIVQSGGPGVDPAVSPLVTLLHLFILLTSDQLVTRRRQRSTMITQS